MKGADSSNRSRPLVAHFKVRVRGAGPDAFIRLSAPLRTVKPKIGTRVWGRT